MKNRIFIVEGLPCTGKSTTSKYIADLLKQKGYAARWVDEGTGHHPADYEFHSFMTEEEINRMSEQEQADIFKAAKQQEGGFIIPLEQLQGELLEKVSAYKIYDKLPWERENKVMIKGWRDFIHQISKEEIYVFNSCLLQNPMCETMVRFNLPYGLSKGYIKHLFYEIRELNPIVIYLSQTQAADRIASVAEERGAEWLRMVIDYHVNGLYGRAHHLQGFEGYITCLEERQKREINILAELDTPHMIIEDPYTDWERTYGKLADYIERLV